MREHLMQILEGAILAADQPLSIDRMIGLFPDDAPSRAAIREALAAIEAACEGRGFELREVASGYRFQVRVQYGEAVGQLWDERPPRYSRALLETLALIAYKQPITRGDIEEIRGVSTSTNIIRSLLEREWIRVVGHRDVPGRPALYASTRTFLDYFNLSSLEELPPLAEIRDLDKVNTELDLSDALVVARTLDVTEDAVEDLAEDDTDLDAVTDTVNQIQENIRNLFRADDAEADVEEEGEETEVIETEVIGTEAVETEAVGTEAAETAGDATSVAGEPAGDVSAGSDAAAAGQQAPGAGNGIGASEEEAAAGTSFEDEPDADRNQQGGDQL